MKINHMIDHTILKADAKTEDVIRYCKEAMENGFASVCVNSCHALTVAENLKGSDVKTCCVVGFPLGAMQTSAKAFETKEACKNGAQEIDMVINIGALKEKNDELVRKDIEEVIKAADGACVKVIIETCLLNEEEKRRACKLSLEAGAHFVKTSTGFSTAGALEEDVRLMKDVVKDKAKVKASGGIRTKEDAMKMIEAGADRIGVGNGMLLI